jgi:predicted MFS family arabinose efflux permease
MQSFVLKEYLIDARGMGENQAAAYLSGAMIPCFIITAFAPFGRILVDYIGKKRVLLANIILLTSGCILCLTAHSILVYLVGNALISFCCSLDIQYIYIVENLPANRRATVRGIAGGVAAGAAMLIPLFRFLCVDRGELSWKSLYVVAGFMGVLVFLLTWALMPRENSHRAGQKEQIEEAAEKRGLKEYAVCIFKSPIIRNSLFILVVLGTATAGISYYNEPMLTFRGYGENAVNLVLVIEPVTILVLQSVNGILADKLGRKRVLIGDIIMAMITLCAYVAGCHYIINSVFLGIFWGAMVGLYFAAEGLMQIIIMESGDERVIGGLSAAATLCYGIGDLIGMVVISLVVNKTGMGIAKVLMGVPTLALTLVCLAFLSPKSQASCPHKER